jgi:hypothetical protein
MGNNTKYYHIFRHKSSGEVKKVEGLKEESSDYDVELKRWKAQGYECVHAGASEETANIWLNYFSQ